MRDSPGCMPPQPYPLNIAARMVDGSAGDANYAEIGASYSRFHRPTAGQDGGGYDAVQTRI